MADHLFRKTWGSLGTPALLVALLVFVLATPGRARADSPTSGAVGQLSAVVPAAAQAAVSAALNQASSAGANVAVTVPVSPAPAAVVPASPPPAAGPSPTPSTPTPSASTRSTSMPLAPVASVLSGPVTPAPPSQPAAATATAAAPAASATPTSNASAPGPASIGQSAAAALSGSLIRSIPGKATGQRAVHGITRHPRRPGWGGRSTALRHPVAPASPAWRAPLWSPTTPLAAPARHHSREAAPAHRNTLGGPADRGHGSRPPLDPAAAAPTVQLPPSSALPPAGVESVAVGGASGAAGATAAALLALVGICLMRALLPGLLALRIGRWQSALLVCRLERPG
jgi:hypothetical protein